MYFRIDTSIQNSDRDILFYLESAINHTCILIKYQLYFITRIKIFTCKNNKIDKIYDTFVANNYNRITS